MAGTLRDFFNFNPNKNKDNKEAYWTCPRCKTRNPLETPFCLKCAEEEAQSEVEREKVRLEIDNNPLVATLVQTLNMYLQVAQLPSRDVAEEAARLGIVINAPQEIALVPVGQLDKLANRFIDSNRLMATGSGALMGFPGGLLMLATIPADISALTYYAFRTISGIAQSYGFETRSEEGRAIALLLFAGASGIESIEIAGSQVLLSSLSRNILSKPYRDFVTKELVKRIAMELSKSIARQGASRIVPVLGSVVGGTANYIFMSNLAERSKKYYRARLLEMRGKSESKPNTNGTSNGRGNVPLDKFDRPTDRYFDEVGEDNPI